jgi:hypothetical protein
MEKNEIKFTDDERTEMTHLNGEYQSLLLEFGELYLRNIQVKREQTDIDLTETDLSEVYADLQKKESDLMTRIQKKYGPGKPDPARGTYIKSEVEK